MVVGYEELLGAQENCLPHLEPLVLELNSLQNQLKDKNRELGLAKDEIKGLRATEVLKDKAMEELRNQVNKLDAKLRLAENLLEHKNLEIKKLSSEKKDALAAQYAAEGTLRRVYAEQKDTNYVPLDAVIAPLEAEIKIYKNEVAALLEDKKALERLTKSKESALLEAERILQSALERALIVEEVQNQNFELRRHIEIYQEENKILEKSNRQKVIEVEKLSQATQELEQAILTGAAAANAIRDYQRQIFELNEEKKAMERELARVKVSANRVATVASNGWKDGNDRVMPVKEWLEERKLMQTEMQRLRDKLAVSDRRASTEAQLKDKLKLRLKTLEEGLKHVSGLTINRAGKSNNILGFLTSSGGLRKRSTSHPRASTVGRSSPLHQVSAENESANADGQLKNDSNLKKKLASGEHMLRRSIWADMDVSFDKYNHDSAMTPTGDRTNDEGNKELHSSDDEDVVSGFLYDRLQKEVINLRKHCEVRDNTLDAKDEEIKMLGKKVEALAKAVEVESKKLKREAATKEKEAAAAKVDHNRNSRNTNPSKSRVTKAS